MKKKYFFTLIIAAIGMMLFSLGMCMCLLPEWGVFKEGLVVGLVGGGAIINNCDCLLQNVGDKSTKA